MARQGANVVIAYLPGEPGEEAQEAIAACGGEVLAQPMDTRDTARIRGAVAKTLERFGRIDALQ